MYAQYGLCEALHGRGEAASFVVLLQELLVPGQREAEQARAAIGGTW